ncbi:MAG TPA: hypothetical protein VFP55_09530 [Solirubrobacteraceae bacterium]|nr:hypothetical protein [Solirubrobacteraceae bacterium]
MTFRTKVTLDGDHARRVAIFALWRIASTNIIGSDGLSDGFYDKAWATIHPAYAPGEGLGEAEHRLVRLNAVQTAARAVARAEAGQRLALPVSPRELDEALRDFLCAIDQNQELLHELPAEEQEDIARCRGAAAQLLWELEERALPTGLLPPDFPEPPRVYRRDVLHDIKLPTG